MNIKSTSLGLLGVSIGMGAMLSLAPINPVYAGSFNREILDANGQKMGRMTFAWDDNNVTNNMLKGFDSLTSFSLMDYENMNYDLDFAENTHFNNFEFNVMDGKLDVYAYNRSRTTQTRKYGFQIKSKDFNSDLIAADIPTVAFPTHEHPLDQALKTNRYFVNLNLGEPVSSDSATISSSNSFMSDNAQFVIPAAQDPQSVPENSLTTALLIIAGLVFLSPHKIF
ncbi:MAG: hypothetical protein QNJ33_08625 [Crocosphaera sp.]|nr:hypothetical protein [Crocosphaera sp.]